MGPAGLFWGRALSGSTLRSPVSVMADSACLAMYLPYRKIIHPCPSLHESHCQLMENLVTTISNKYFALDRRVELLICKSLAGAHLHLAAGRGRAGRQQHLYGGADPRRPGRVPELRPQRPEPELSRMQQEGLIETYRGSFKILDVARLRAQYQK